MTGVGIAVFGASNMALEKRADKCRGCYDLQREVALPFTRGRLRRRSTTVVDKST